MGALAQCPAATSSCTPGGAPAANTAFGMGIFNVTMGSINNSTPGSFEGYKDYSCTQNAALLIGTDAPISIKTNSNADENVRVWIDLNNDGILNATSELVFSSNAARTHTGNLRLPAGTVTGTRLRMRVAADYVNAPVPTTCSTPQYSQTEDYSVTATQSTVAPVADFTADQPQTCSGTVQFTDQSQNAPTSWLWTFGDGTTSPLQNPTHTYTTAGSYTVSLTATNGSGSTTKTRTSYISYDSAVPKAAACTPQTLAYCCNYGITQFTLGPLSKASANGQVGYEDFTCSGKATLTIGNRYTISLTTNPTSAQDTRVWLDLNNDGSFTTSELIYGALNTTSPSGTLVLPATAITEQPLRLRVVSDYVGSPFTACSGIQYGQAEDYTITLRANTSAPVADFTSNYTAGTCQTAVQFTDQSQNAPTSWLWTFGDGTTSPLQNPAHTYTTAGSYTVSLTATNAFGAQTKTVANYVQVAIPCNPYCASTGQNQNIWITNVALAATNGTSIFSHNSVADPNGYGNFLAQQIPLRLGQTATLRVSTNSGFQRTTSVWIDWNRDGVFATTELLGDVVSNNPLSMPISVPNQAALLGSTRMRIVTRLNANQANPCWTSQINAETEDYTVLISGQATPTTAARELTGLEVFPNPITGSTAHLRLLDANSAGLYTVRVESLLGARLLEKQLRLQPAQDAALDLSGLPAGLYVLRLQNANGQTAVRRLIRE
ncbi:Por secretion system C-terminal sorting domain-containing protein [Hymenobacter gelipurpurascens]|uniref:Por secretion system C-terminal sorting domain-containing protein n=2 Tax=Hymenobacter gelipurpurascens TaxID=89968 RepID=A0A212T2U0_9BACT|nr:Por secretion system C-terminal sorting domain-containing protein [Hymenobacter gelipurpurascens]